MHACRPWLTALHLHVGSQGVPLELAVEGAVRVWQLGKVGAHSGSCVWRLGRVGMGAHVAVGDNMCALVCTCTTRAGCRGGGARVAAGQGAGLSLPMPVLVYIGQR